MARGPVPDPKSTRLGDRLGILAEQKPTGGRAKWIVWGVVGGAVFVLGLLQAFGVTKSPVAEKVLEKRRAEGSLPGDAPKSGPEAGAPPPAGQGTTK